MHVHILGICGSFTAGLASLAQQLGHRVSGSDANTYPPMGDQLTAQGIAVVKGYHAANLDPEPDCIVVGNAITRGNAELEATLDRGLRYTSAPAWLAEHVLQGRWVLGVAGTHGKTTTSSMLAWILDCAGLTPGFLIGGIPENFGLSARLGEEPFFVVEADEYDSAFSDKRSKFVHYRPRTLVINNLEYDHADIFPDIASIQRQFHHLVRTVPGSGLIVHPAGEPRIDEMLDMGCWTRRELIFDAAGARGDAAGAGSEPAGTWRARTLHDDGSHFEVWLGHERVGTVEWGLLGDHNMSNALGAIATARHAGVAPPLACEALGEFRNVKRRLEVCGTRGGITVYDDFAHHPTAIATTLAGLRRHVGQARIVAILEPRSNTMAGGAHRDTLGPSLTDADLTWVYRPADLAWDLDAGLAVLSQPVHVLDSVENIVSDVAGAARPGDHIVVMSNGGFQGIHRRLLDALEMR